jgi:hypothetical protein
VAETDVSSQDVEQASSFLQSFLQAKIEDIDVSEGSPYFDHLVRGMAYIYAILQRQVGIVRARQSILTLSSLPAEESASDAADAILANFFRTRSLGKRSRGPVVVHFSQRTDALVRLTDRFRKTSQLIFYVDSDADFFIDGRSMRPVIDSTGRVVEYTATVPVIAARSGTEYNVAQGVFASFDRFSPFVTLVENTVPFSDGLDRQDTPTFIQASATAIALRALINARSNDAILTESFPETSQVTTVGYGDDEMSRDIVNELATRTVIHTGGHMDVYLREPVQQVVEDLIVGAAFARPDERVLTFKHDPGIDFTTGLGIVEQVVQGDVLNVAAGLSESPFQFVVVAVRALELDVALRTPFTQATDEQLPIPVLSYSVGNNYPLFDNKVAATVGSATTTRQIQESNRVMLAGRPVGLIKQVEILDAPATFDPLKDPVTGTLLFRVRANNPALVPPASASQLQYRVLVRNPQEAQSSRTVTQIEVGWPGTFFDAMTMQITYETLSGFDLIDAFVRNPLNRPAAANTLVRGLHPVQLSMAIPYSLAIQPPSLATVITPFDEATVSANLEAFISSYRGLNVIDQSLIATEARSQASGIAAIYPFTITYELLGPDGRVFRYATEDVVTVFPDGTSSTARLTNPLDFGLPTAGYHAALQHLLRGIGISNRTIRYLAAGGSVSLERRS